MKTLHCVLNSHMIEGHTWDEDSAYEKGKVIGRKGKVYEKDNSSIINVLYFNRAASRGSKCS